MSTGAAADAGAAARGTALARRKASKQRVRARQPVRVAVRVRPFLADEPQADVADIGVWLSDGRRIWEADERADARAFAFDNVFGMDCGTAEVYHGACQPLVDACMRGMNGTILVYGQTNTGKTHTMAGSIDGTEEGIIFRTVQQIFRYIEQHPALEFLLRMSYVEIYNEELKDLLCNERKPPPLNLRENEGGFYLENLNYRIIKNEKDVRQALRDGEALRHVGVGVSNLSDRSSRSHCVFQIVVEVMDRAAAAQEASDSPTEGDDDPSSFVRVATLNLVDLAGSETLDIASSSTTQRETKSINVSLTQLKSVIAALSSGEKRRHVPYRNSCLTKLLKPALGGNSHTALICTISPTDECRRQSRMTLLFGEQTRNIKNKPIVNVEKSGSKTLMAQYRKKILALQQRLREPGAADNEDPVEKLARIERERDQLQREIERLSSVMVSSRTVATRLQDAMESNRQLQRELQVENENKKSAENEATKRAQLLRHLSVENVRLARMLDEEARQRLSAEEQLRVQAVRHSEMAESSANMDDALARVVHDYERRLAELEGYCGELQEQSRTAVQSFEAQLDELMAEFTDKLVAHQDHTVQELVKLKQFLTERLARFQLEHSRSAGKSGKSDPLPDDATTAVGATPFRETIRDEIHETEEQQNLRNKLLALELDVQRRLRIQEARHQQALLEARIESRRTAAAAAASAPGAAASEQQMAAREVAQLRRLLSSTRDEYEAELGALRDKVFSLERENGRLRDASTRYAHNDGTAPAGRMLGARLDASAPLAAGLRDSASAAGADGAGYDGDPIDALHEAWDPHAAPGVLSRILSKYRVMHSRPAPPPPPPPPPPVEKTPEKEAGKPAPQQR